MAYPICTHLFHFFLDGFYAIWLAEKYCIAIHVIFLHVAIYIDAIAELARLIFSQLGAMLLDLID